MKNSLLFTGNKVNTIAGMLLLIALFAFGSIEKASAQECVITQTQPCPTGPIIACANLDNGGVLGASISWTPPQFTLDCGTGTGTTGTQMSFELPESQNSCWIYNKVQRTGNNGGRLQLNQSTGTGLPYFVTPEFFIPSTGITGSVEIYADQTTTLNIYYAKNGIKVSGAVETIVITASTTIQAIALVLDPPATAGFYQLMFEFTGLTNNKSYVDNLDIDAIIADNGCTGDIDFYTTVTSAPPLALINPAGTFFPTGTYIITYTATYNSSDGSQSSLDCSFTVIVNSVTASATTTPSDCGTSNGTITLTASSTPLVTAYEYSINGNPTWTPFITPVTLTGLGANTYSINVRASFPDDGVCYLVTPVIAIIGNNIDAIPPVVTCPGPLTLTGCDNTAISVANSGLVYSSVPTTITYNQFIGAGATATDNCSIASYSYQDSQSGSCPVVVTRTFTATDNSSNSTSCSQTITIGHTAPPQQIGGPVAIASTVSCINLAVAPTTLPVVQDYCGNVLIPGTPTIGGTYINCEGTKTFNYTFTDCAGLTYNWTYTYTIEREPFAPIAPTSATVACVSNIVMPTPPIVYDNCGSLITNISGPVVSTIPTCEGDITYTWTYADCEGNTQLYVHTVTIEHADFTLPANTTATIACIADLVVPTPPAVNDACGNPITPIAGTAPIAPLCEGTMVYSWTYTDCEGNSHVWSHTVTIERLPFAPIAPTSATVACVSNIVMPTPPIVYDNCGSLITNISGPVVSTMPTCEGDVTYTWTYTDCEGNTQLYVHTVTIEHVDFALPANTTATIACIADLVVPTPPAVNDACGNPITPVAGTAPIAPLCEGTMVYSWTYTDCEGNSHVWSHTVTIERLPFAPIAPTSATVACAANIVMPTLPTVFDNCGTLLIPSGPVVSTMPTCEGDVTYTWTYTDCEENTQLYVHTVTIEHADFTLPANTTATVACIADIVVPTPPAINDACGNPITPVAGTAPIAPLCEGTMVYSWTYTDCEGNSHVWSHTVTIERLPFAPIAPTSATVACASNIVMPTLPTVFDNCGTLLIPTGPVVSTMPTCEGVVTYTWTYTDCEENTQLYVHTVTIEHADFTLPANTTATIACIADLVVPTPPAVNDTCGNPITPVAGTAPIAPLCEGTMVYSWTYTDCEGNSHVWSHTVTIERLPFAPIAPTSATVACAANIVMPTLPTVTDNCGTLLIPTGPVVSTMPTCEGDVTYTWTYTDCEENTQLYVHTITIDRADFTMPVNGSETVQCISSVYQPTPPIVTDACGATINPTGPVIGGTYVSCEGTRTYTWTYSDCAGNSHPWTYTFNIDDNTPPTFTRPANTTVYTDANCNYNAAITVTGDVTNENDNCATGLQATYSDQVVDGTCEGSHIIYRTWSLADNCSNAAVDQVQIITVIDNVAPVINTVAGSLDVTLECSDVTGITAALALAPEATDNCSALTMNLISDNTTPNATCENGYIRIRTWNFTDDCGNTSAPFTQVITVTDESAPVITLPSANLTMDCYDAAAVATWISTASATDACQGVVEVTSNFTPPADNCEESVTVTFTAVDNCGNIATATKAFIVDDNTAPIVSTLAGSLDATIECSDAAALTAALALAPSASDNCSEVVTMALVSDVTTPDATCANGYVRVRTWNFTDDCGNVSANFVQTITVHDNTAPVITAPTPVNIVCDLTNDPTTQINAWLATALASDNCDASVAVTNNFEGFTQTCNEIVIVTFYATDDCGNQATPVTSTFTFIDEIAPVITTIVGSLNATVECSNTTGIAAALALTPTATDNCTPLPYIHLVSDVTTVNEFCVNGYIRVRTWNFTDDCGNVSVNFIQTITVDDNTAPVINTIAGSLDATLQCSDDSGIAAALALVPTATDNCSAVVNINLISDLSTPNATCINGYVRVRTWNFTDNCGNTSENFVQTITVIDNTAPVISTLAGSLDATIECSDASALTAALALAPSASDNCSEVVNMNLVGDVTTPDATCVNGYVRVRTWNFTDDCGNTSANFVQTITVIDNTAPVINTAVGSLDVTLECSDVAAINAALVLVPTATDNCSEVVTINLVSDNTTFDETCENGYVRVRIWNFTDDCENTSENFVQTITVNDNTAPVISTLTGSLDVTLECSDESGITAALAMAPTATDNCSEAVTMNMVTDITTPDATCINGYVRLRTWNFTDDCGNVSANFIQTITVDDNTAPVINTLAGSLDVTLECSDETGITAALAMTPTATDNCSDVVTMDLVSDNTTFNETCENGYVRVRTWNFTDDCGNVSANFVQTITVMDNTAPVISTLAGSLDVTLECSDEAGLTAALVMVPTATDNCSEVLTMNVVSDITTPDATCENGYVRVRVWNFTDDCGNVSANFVQTITVEDNTTPVISTLAGSLDVTLECSDATGITAALAMMPSATDNCSEIVTMNLVSDITTPDETCVNGYVRVRTWNFTDDCENVSANFVQTITVFDLTAPVITAPVPLQIVCDITTDPTTQINEWLASAYATDNCDDMVTVTNNYEGYTQSCNETITVTFNATDACGNQAVPVTSTFTFIDEIAPVITTVAGGIDATVECSDELGLIAALAMVPTATDNCTQVPTIHLISDVTTNSTECDNEYTRVRTWNFTDDCGNTSVDFTQTISIIDNTPPSWTVTPTDLTVECDGEGNTAALNSWLTGYEGTDNCGVVSITNNYTGLSDLCGSTGSATVTFSISDECGNTTNTVATFTIVDTQAPVFTYVPENITVECGGSFEVGVPVAGDDCSSVVIAYLGEVRTDGNCANNYTLLRTWSATDDCGNVTNATQLITVQDNTAPEFTFIPANVTVECDEIPEVGTPIATDLCDSEVTITYLGEVRTDGNCQNNYTLTRTWTATDNCANVATATQVITVNDVTAPVFTVVPENITVECNGSGNASELQNWLNSAIATDNCGVATITNNYTGLTNDCGATGTATVTFTANDGCNNISTVSATFTIIDTQAPEINAPANIFADNDPGLCGAQVNIPVPNADDDCGTITITNNITGTGNASGFYEVGSTTIIWTAVDECGNTSTDQTVVTVEDTEAPHIICPQHITVVADPGVCEAFIEVPQPIVSDNCEIREVTNTFNHTDDATGIYPVGTTVVWWTVVDESGNTDNCFMNVTVIDEQDPTIICPEDISVNTDPGVCEAQVNVPLPEAADNCTINTLINDFNGTGDASGIYPVGTTIVTWTVTDMSGNTATCSMTVTVTDNELPTIICPENISVNTDPGVCGADVTIPQPELHDNCDINTLSNDFNNTSNASGFYPTGTTEVIWTVTDIHGNSATCTMTVTVTDNEAPSIICPTDIAQNTDAGVCGANVTVPLPEAIDNCGIHSVINDFNGTNDASGFYPTGVTVITWTVTDIHGLTATCETTVTVTDNELPVIICPTDIEIAADQTCQVTLEIPIPEVTDNCSVENFINDYTSTANASGIYPVGTTVVTWTVTDINGNVTTCAITVHVTAPPFAVDDYATTEVGTPVTIPVLVNDTDCNNDIAPNTVINITNPVNGSVMVDPATGEFIYTPNAGFTGTDFFEYRVCDAEGLCDEATVTITIEDTGVDKLIAVDDAYSMEENTVLEITNLENDIYTPYTPVITVLVPPTHGNLVIHSDMTATYTPDTDYDGTDEYTYILSDLNNGATADTAITTITIVPAPARDTLIIYNVITPDNDGRNDKWVIDGIEEYGDNEVLLFNRWGDQIRQFDRYDNNTVVWDGTNASGDKLPAATYYYIIRLRSIEKVYTGWVIIHSKK